MQLLRNASSKSAGPQVTWGTLSDVLLLPGSGLCLDVGCGDGRYRAEIQAAGYTWIGLDLRRFSRLRVQGNALHLPFVDHTFSAVVMWQTLEHLPQPWAAMAEVYRVLRQGGWVFGSTSFLEPYHDFSFFGFSELGLRRILLDCGFETVEVFPGISCFPLIAWTLFGRMTGRRIAEIVYRGVGVAMSVFTRCYPAMRRLTRLLNSSSAGDLNESYWFSRLPLEFAGHLAFRACKPSNRDSD